MSNDLVFLSGRSGWLAGKSDLHPPARYTSDLTKTVRCDLAGECLGLAGWLARVLQPDLADGTQWSALGSV